MYVYIKSESQLWTVGFYEPSGKWRAESDHDTQESAANRVAFLNGSTSAISNLKFAAVQVLECIHQIEKQNDSDL